MAIAARQVYALLPLRPVAAILLALMVAGLARGAETATLGVFAYRPKPIMEARYRPLVDYLNERLPDIRIALSVLDQPELDEGLARREIDLVFTNPTHYLRIRNRHSLGGPLATLVNLGGGQPVRQFGGVIITAADRPDIARLADLKGRTIALGNFQLLGSYQAQSYELLGAGIRLPADARLYEVGHHDEAVRAVLAGEAEAGFVRTGIIESLAAEGTLDPARLRVINPQTLPGFPFLASTRLYPEWPLVALPHLDQRTARRIAAALLLLESDHPAARAAGIAGFAPPADYSSVEELARALRLPPYDAAPDFTWDDLWQRHRGWIMALALVLALLVLASLRLARLHRRVSRAYERFNRLFENLPEPILLLYQGRFVDCNPAAVAMFGYPSKASLLRATPADISPPRQPNGEDSRVKAEQILASFPATGRQQVEWTHRGADGGELIAEVTLLQLEFNDRPVVLVVLHDITERKRAEMAVAEAEHLYRTLAHGVSTLIWRAGTDQRRNFFNASWLGFTGRSLRQEMGHGWVEGIHPDDRDHCLSIYDAAFNRRDAFSMEFRLHHADGAYHWVLDNGTPSYDSRGNFVGYVGACTDIDDRKRAEQAVRDKTEALARSNAELEQFAYAASHDLRQPLRMISSYAQMLERRLANLLDGDTRQMMGFITDGATRMDQMLHSLLEYSRVGRKGEPMAIVESRAALGEALRFLAPQIQETGAEVRIAGAWPRVLASPDELTRLMQNLIGNAIKYRVSDRAPVITLSAAPDPGGWCFLVEDNGIGIDPGQFGRLFKVFQRLHTRDRYEGTGVGLAVCRKIVERHGGRIWVESAGAGQGCRFCFTLAALPDQPPGLERP